MTEQAKRKVRKGWPATAKALVAAALITALGYVCAQLIGPASQAWEDFRDEREAAADTDATRTAIVELEPYPCDPTLRAYFGALNAGDYGGAWAMLTSDFQAAENPMGIEVYAGYWSKTPVEVVKVRQAAASDVFAVCEVWLRYPLVNDDSFLEIELVFDEVRGTWLVDTEGVMDYWIP